MLGCLCKLNVELSIYINVGYGKSLSDCYGTRPEAVGKTTLVRHLFQDKPYVSLENPDERSFAEEDPKGFLENYPDGAILDEIQRLPLLLSYLQGIVDDAPSKKGLFILTIH